MGGGVGKGLSGSFSNPINMLSGVGGMAMAPMTGGASLALPMATGAVTGGMHGGLGGALGGLAGGTAMAGLGSMLPGASPFGAGGVFAPSVAGPGLSTASLGAGSTSGLAGAANSAITPTFGGSAGMMSAAPTPYTFGTSTGAIPSAVQTGSMGGSGLTAANTGMTPSSMMSAGNNTPSFMKSLNNASQMSNLGNMAGGMIAPPMRPQQPMQFNQMPQMGFNNQAFSNSSNI